MNFRLTCSTCQKVCLGSEYFNQNFVKFLLSAQISTWKGLKSKAATGPVCLSMLSTRASSAPFTSFAASYLKEALVARNYVFIANLARLDSHGYHSSVRSANNQPTRHCSFSRTASPDQLVVSLVHGQARHQRHVMTGLAEIQSINLKIGVGAERGIKLLRCCPRCQVNWHLSKVGFHQGNSLIINIGHFSPEKRINLSFNRKYFQT